MLFSPAGPGRLTMHLDIATLLFAMTVCMVTMAIALPAVMGAVNAPARCAQGGVVLQGAAGRFCSAPGWSPRGSAADRVLSTLAMAGIAGGIGLNAAAFDLWCGRARTAARPALMALVLPLGYAAGFRAIRFASAGPTGC